MKQKIIACGMVVIFLSLLGIVVLFRTAPQSNSEVSRDDPQVKHPSSKEAKTQPQGSSHRLSQQRNLQTERSFQENPSQDKLSTKAISPDISKTNLSKNPYAELQPWVEDYVWSMPHVKNIDEFLEKYKVPKSGNKKKDKEYKQKLMAFAQAFRGFKLKNHYFAVVNRDDINGIVENTPGHPSMYGFSLIGSEGEKISCKIMAFESEQDALDYYPRKYLSASGNLNVLLVYSKHINFGVFCRYLQQEGFVEYVKGIYSVELYSRTKDKNIDMLNIAYIIDGILSGSVIVAENDYAAIEEIKGEIDADK